MPPEQLQETMEEAFGEDWEELFYGFDTKPIAAASIGQVHRTVSPDGRDIVLKVQYPGVAQSIDSDVDNIASLLRISGLLPTDLDIQPLLDDAKKQLHDEADYLKEAEFLQACIGCGQCANVCPNKCISLFGLEAGILGRSECFIEQ